MNEHPIFLRLFADLADAGLLSGPEQRAGETCPQTHGADEPAARARMATPIRPYPPIGDADL